MVKRVDKPWGYEIIFAHTKHYVGKILHIKKGHKLSLQYHNDKEETIFLQSGKITLETHADASINLFKMQPGASFHIPPRMIHRMIAEEDSEVIEASTSQLDDVVRIEDDYGRE